MTDINKLQSVDLIHHLEVLRTSAGWQILLELAEKNDIKTLKDRLLTGEYGGIEDRNRDVDRLEAINTLFASPARYIDALSGGEAYENLDPYYATKKEVDADRAL